MPIGPVAMKVVYAALLLTGSLGPAAAQFPDFRSLFTPNTAPGTVPAPAARDWSGEPGASGHPLMTREAILSAAARIASRVISGWPEAPGSPLQSRAAGAGTVPGAVFGVKSERKSGNCAAAGPSD